MAIKFNIKKYEQIKSEYIEYLKTCNANAISLRNFESYKIYLDADEEVKKARESIHIQKQRRAVVKEVAKTESKQSTHYSTFEQLQFYEQHYLSIKRQISVLWQPVLYNTETELDDLRALINNDSLLKKDDKELLLRFINNIKRKIKPTKKKKSTKLLSNVPTAFKGQYNIGKKHTSSSCNSVFSSNYSLKAISNYRKR
jgi:hypothetical protein